VTVIQGDASDLWEYSYDGEMVGGKEGGEVLEYKRYGHYLGAFTSAPLSINNLTTISFPPEQAACRGSTPSMTELMG
jgi:hypothetical protein